MSFPWILDVIHVLVEFVFNEKNEFSQSFLMLICIHDELLKCLLRLTVEHA